MDALRGLIYAPVSLAIQSEVNEELVRRLNAGEIPGARKRFWQRTEQGAVGGV